MKKTSRMRSKPPYNGFVLWCSANRAERVEMSLEIEGLPMEKEVVVVDDYVRQFDENITLQNMLERCKQRNETNALSGKK